MDGFSYISKSAEDTVAFGKNLISHLTPGTKIALVGDLGAGKTTLVKGIYQAMFDKSPRVVNSPTFTYLNVYEDTIYHFDLYRLETKDQFISMGFDEHLEEDKICIIEWPEIITSILPEKMLTVSIGYLDQDKRTIEVR